MLIWGPDSGSGLWQSLGHVPKPSGATVPPLGQKISRLITLLINGGLGRVGLGMVVIKFCLMRG